MAASVCCMSTGSSETPPTAAARLAALPGLKVPFDETLDGTIGLEWLEVGPDRVTSQLVVGNHVRQPFGLVHGGLFAVIAESAASTGASVSVAERGEMAVGLSNNTAFLRPFVGEGTIHSVATRIHAGRTTQLWDVEHRDDEQRLCATSRVTIAIRPPRAPTAS